MTPLLSTGDTEAREAKQLAKGKLPTPRTAAELRPCPRGTSLPSPVKRMGHSCSHPFPRPQRFLVVRVRGMGWQLPCG